MGVDEPRRPYITRGPLGGIRLYLTYHPTFITWLKQTVPALGREWDEDTKSWYVGSTWADDVLAHARASFPNVTVIKAYTDPNNQWQGAHRERGDRERARLFNQQYYRAPPPPIRQVKLATDHSELYVTDDAPPEVVRAAYKALARLYHPDQPEGSTKKMQALNAAFDRLKERWKE